MTSPAPPDRRKPNRLVIWSNQLINLFWSGLCLGPLGYYCYNNMNSTWLYAFLGLSFVPLLVPNAWLDRIQLSASARFYTRLGIRTIRKYTQDGDLINQWLERKLPGYNPTKRVSRQQLINKSYMQEKFHLGCFAFFLLSSLYALHQDRWGWSSTILISNVVYNLYPILLQQYNRVRLTQLIQRQLSTEQLRITTD